MISSSPIIQKGWQRALVFLLVWLVIQIGISSLLYLLAQKLFPGQAQQPMSSMQLFVMAIIGLVTNVPAVWVFRRMVDRKSFISLGFEWKGYQKHGYTGLFAALLILALGTIILSLAGNLHFIGVAFSPMAIVTYLLVMLMVAVGEEVVIRGYILNNLLESFPKWVALLISALLFAAFHLFNPSISLLSMLGIFTGGLLLGINYIYTKNLWYGIFFHFAWNFFQGPILGYSVSGLEIESLLIPSIQGANWWTGGPFGFEASVLACGLELILTVGLFYYYNGRRWVIS